MSYTASDKSTDLSDIIRSDSGSVDMMESGLHTNFTNIQEKIKKIWTREDTTKLVFIKTVSATSMICVCSRYIQGTVSK